jgi:hypothetical protein
VNWVKALIRDTDQSNLFLGESVDLNWIFDELGLDDIKTPAPHPRPKPELPEDDYNETEDFEDDDFDPLIDEFLVEDYIEKISHFLGDMNSRGDGLLRMKASGCNFMDVFHSELDEGTTQKTRDLLDFFIPAIWYALGLEGQIFQINSDTLVDEFDAVLMELEDIVSEGMPTTVSLLADLSLNMEMFMAASQVVEVYQQEASEFDKLTDAETSDLMFHLIGVTNVLASYEMGM